MGGSKGIVIQLAALLGNNSLTIHSTMDTRESMTPLGEYMCVSHVVWRTAAALDNRMHVVECPLQVYPTQT